MVGFAALTATLRLHLIGCSNAPAANAIPQYTESSGLGKLLNQDTSHWDPLKGVGKVYVQVVIDIFCSPTLARPYTSKMPIPATETLYDRIMQFYEALGVIVQAILTDHGREFCGKPEQHAYELMLAMEGIEHRRTKIATPRTNGFVERMNRTLLDECFRVAGRQTWYITPAEIQRDLDTFLRYYNLERSHQGYRLKGRTPAQALRGALAVDTLPPIVPEQEVTPENEPDTLVA